MLYEVLGDIWSMTQPHLQATCSTTGGAANSLQPCSIGWARSKAPRFVMPLYQVAELLRCATGGALRRQFTDFVVKRKRAQRLLSNTHRQYRWCLRVSMSRRDRPRRAVFLGDAGQRS